VDRESVISLLGDALADGRLTVTEHSERMEQACAARTLGELTGLTADLIPAEAQPIRLDSGSLHAVFGSARRGGRWVVPARLRVRALFGSVELDLREAILQRKHTVIEVVLLAGSITLLVPEGAQVNITGRTRLAFRDLRVRPMPDGPVVEIGGHLFLGSIKAAAPKRSWRQRVRGRIRRD
jgi:DUF1707 SHOCT-like domain/Cell wall-active antibiotics response LiaF, C-terminal